MDADQYVSRVLAQMPETMARRSQIAIELRSHIADRLALGGTLENVLGGLGTPQDLAASYLSDLPLIAGSFGRRLAAKAIDLAAVWIALGPMAYLAWRYASYRTFTLMAILLATLGVFFPLALYTAISEFRSGRTLGKHLLGLRVVRDTGTRLTLGRAIVRQIPVWMQLFLVDGVFALVTENQQRAFELLSQTRVVRALDPAPH